MAKKKTTKKRNKKTEAAPRKIPVFIIDTETRAFLLEYLQLSPAGQYAPAAINNVVAALQNAGSGELTVTEAPDEG